MQLKPGRRDLCCSNLLHLTLLGHIHWPELPQLNIQTEWLKNIDYLEVLRLDYN